MTPQEIAIAALEEASHEDDPVDIAVTYKIALEEIAKGGWVPVEERLPEPSESVLVSLLYGDIGMDLYGVIYYEDDGSPVYAWHEFDGEVTAWMPLPEAYKEER